MFIWAGVFYQFIAPSKDPGLILLLISGAISYFVIFSVVAIICIRILKMGRQLLLVPVAFMVLLFFVLDGYTCIYMVGLALISEFLLLKGVRSLKDFSKKETER